MPSREKNAPFFLEQTLSSGNRDAQVLQSEMELYDNLCSVVPIIAAAIQKIVRLAGGFHFTSDRQTTENRLNEFAATVPVDLSGMTLQTFADRYLTQLLLYGNALGEILLDPQTLTVTGLNLGNPSCIIPISGSRPGRPAFMLRQPEEKPPVLISRPEFILFSTLSPTAGSLYGQSVLRGVPALAGALMNIYHTIHQNFQRLGNLRYAVTYKPQDAADRAYARERACQIAQQWSDGMRAAAAGDVRDFIAVGEVDIKVIGADCQPLDTQVPVRQLLEQIIAKLSIPPFLLGLSWSSTERMSAQQADILTSELEAYRRLLTVPLRRIGETFLSSIGLDGSVNIEWDIINLQDESEMADARLKNAQAAEIEARLAQTV